MTNGTVILLGDLPAKRSMFDCLGTEFGFSFQDVQTVDDLQRLHHEQVVAVIFWPSGLGIEWDEALNAVLDAVPKALPILCHGFSDHIDWPRAADAGAFHSIHVPLNTAEIRQSLGFVWALKTKAISKSTGRKIASRAA